MIKYSAHKSNRDLIKRHKESALKIFVVVRAVIMMIRLNNQSCCLQTFEHTITVSPPTRDIADLPYLFFWQSWHVVDELYVYSICLMQ